MRHTHRALAVAFLMAASLAMAPVVLQTGDVGEPRVFEPEGMNHDCLEPVPDELNPNGLTGGGTVNLHVRLVLDLAESRALDAVVNNPKTARDERQDAIDAFGATIVRDHLRAGAQSYDAIDVTLDYASFDVLRTADLRSGTRDEVMQGRAAIDTAKAQYGGSRPPGTDVVYVLTDRDLHNGADSSLAGLADCIGGVHHGDTAFATGEFRPDAEFSIGVPFYREFTAKVAAHEVGHLMGAHHHYQACGPYAATSLQDGGGAGACTLMTNLVDLVTFPFSPTNSLVVRGHAEQYAAHNDGDDHSAHG